MGIVVGVVGNAILALVALLNGNVHNQNRRLTCGSPLLLALLLLVSIDAGSYTTRMFAWCDDVNAWSPCFVSAKRLETDLSCQGSFPLFDDDVFYFI